VILVVGLCTAGPRVGAQTAEPDQGTRATDALNLLENQDYESFRDFHADGAMFEATVERDGRWFHVRIDPERRSVTVLA